jgi:hypothetical protein
MQAEGPYIAIAPVERAGDDAKLRGALFGVEGLPLGLGAAFFGMAAACSSTATDASASERLCFTAAKALSTVMQLSHVTPESNFS